ncbi:maleylpyruvate isomerase family mycothiol-dependent enzyme [Streptomyces sp. NPDC097107]|uniref:maleylpyruvate isomerase family mycothiol-dependent enzyme n=1 Tax=Streptomyces sp. NPDC097107 TaxID=3366089 RepID=UPI003806C49D
MQAPFEAQLRAERLRFIDTVAGLSEDEFNNGSTLCADWAPRDVLSHVISVDRVHLLLAHGLCLNAANKAQKSWGRALTRPELMRRADTWGRAPSLSSRTAAMVVLGDLAIHHQDILRGLGRTRDIPDPVSTAIFRDGLMLSLWLNGRALRFRPVPSDGRPARGLPTLVGAPEVHGTREALGMWLAGRDATAGELSFV